MIEAKLIPVENVANIAREQHVLGAIVYEDKGKTDQSLSSSNRERFPFPVAAIHLFDANAIETTQTTERSSGIAELWLTKLKPDYLNAEGWSIAKTDDFMFATISFPDNGKDITQKTETHYANLFSLLEKSGFPQLIRMWNYVPDINGSDGNNLERYRSFCLGRSLAFSKHFQDHNKMMPAATGVGSLSGEITILVLAQRNSETVMHLENPRQTPAYKYPQAYGPRAPSFARATSLRVDKSRELLFVSGTASIVNSETLHKGDCAEQLEETFRNITILISAENLLNHGLKGGYGLKDLNQIKVYYRHRTDLSLIKKSCERYFSSDAEIAYLYSHICRSDLDVEIEGFVNKPLLIDKEFNDDRQEMVESQV